MTESALSRLLAALAWASAAFFLALRPTVTGPLKDIDAQAMNLLLDAAGLLPLFLAALRAVLAGEIALRRPHILAGLGGGMAVSLAALGAAPDRSFAVPRVTDLAVAVGLTAWLSQRDTTSARRFLWLAAAAAVFPIAVGAFQGSGGLALLRAEIREEEAAREPIPFVPPAWEVSARESRLATDEAFSTFFPFYSNAFAGYLALALPLFCGLLAQARRARVAAALTALLAAVLVAAAWDLLRTGSRGGWAAAGAGLAMLLLRRAGMPRRVIAMLAAGAAAIAFAAIAAVGHPSLAVRLGYWASALRMIWAHPWLGVGPGSAHLYYDFHRASGAGDVRFAHNALLEFAAEGGVFLAAAAVCFWTAVLAGREEAEEVPRPPPARAAATAHAWAAVCLVAAAALPIFLVLHPKTRYVEIETIMAAAAAVAALGIWTLGAGAQAPLWGPWIRRGLSAGLAAALLHALVDFDFQIQGILQTVFPLGGILWAAREGAPPARRIELSNAARLAALALAVGGGYVVFHEIPSRRAEAILAVSRIENRRPGTGPDELRERIAADLDPAIARVPWDTGLLVLKASLYEFLWFQDRREADRRAAADAWAAVGRIRGAESGLATLRLALLADARDPAEAVRAVALLAVAAERLPAWPRPCWELGRRLERIARWPEALAVYAEAEEIPAAEAERDLARRARWAFREALARDAPIPDPQHKLEPWQAARAREAIAAAEGPFPASR